MKKIAITGHLEGIGESLAKVYSSQGYEIVGFSRRNGYDISKLEDRKRIVEQIADCDIFVNNAFSDFAQCELLFEVWQSWEGQKKQIVNISSSMTKRYETAHPNPKFRSSKAALEEASNYLSNRAPWPNIVSIVPCMTDTPRNKQRENKNKANPDIMAELLYKNLSETNFRIQQIVMAVTPLD